MTGKKRPSDVLRHVAAMERERLSLKKANITLRAKVDRLEKAAKAKAAKAKKAAAK